MIAVRFVGGLPLWLGVLVGLLVYALSLALAKADDGDEEAFQFGILNKLQELLINEHIHECSLRQLEDCGRVKTLVVEDVVLDCPTLSSAWRLFPGHGITDSLEERRIHNSQPIKIVLIGPLLPYIDLLRQEPDTPPPFFLIGFIFYWSIRKRATR